MHPLDRLGSVGDRTVRRVDQERLPVEAEGLAPAPGPPSGAGQAVQRLGALRHGLTEFLEAPAGLGELPGLRQELRLEQAKAELALFVPKPRSAGRRAAALHGAEALAGRGGERLFLRDLGLGRFRRPPQEQTQAARAVRPRSGDARRQVQQQRVEADADPGQQTLRAPLQRRRVELRQGARKGKQHLAAIAAQPRPGCPRHVDGEQEALARRSERHPSRNRAAAGDLVGPARRDRGNPEVVGAAVRAEKLGGVAVGAKELCEQLLRSGALVGGRRHLRRACLARRCSGRRSNRGGSAIDGDSAADVGGRGGRCAARPPAWAVLRASGLRSSASTCTAHSGSPASAEQRAVSQGQSRYPSW